MCVCTRARACTHMHVYTMVYKWRSEDDLWELVLIFYHMDPSDQNSVCQVWWQVPVPAEHLAGFRRQF